mgnify:CR=1 FL=1
MSTPQSMTARVEAYLRERRQAGFALRVEGEQLARFARFAERYACQPRFTVSALKSAPVFRPRQRPDFALVSQVNRRGPWARRSMRRR